MKLKERGCGKMCGAITTKCETEGCENYVRYETMCKACQFNLNHPTGV